MSEFIREWYMEHYPTDDLGAKIHSNVTFGDVFLEMANKNDVYIAIGVGDSIIRERLFEHLAEIIGCDYDVVYKLWLSAE